MNVVELRFYLETFAFARFAIIAALLTPHQLLPTGLRTEEWRQRRRLGEVGEEEEEVRRGGEGGGLGRGRSRGRGGMLNPKSFHGLVSFFPQEIYCNIRMGASRQVEG